MASRRSMITYPSTHGVFEDGIAQICEIVHDLWRAGVSRRREHECAGRPVSTRRLSAPMSCHLNLHKTFCIPHGGGGPGMGPICRRRASCAVLAGPSDERAQRGATAIGPVSAAPYGQPQHLADSVDVYWHDGRRGLRQRAPRSRFLNANYMAKRLGEHYRRALHRPERLVSPTNSSSTAGPLRRARASKSMTSPSD